MGNTVGMDIQSLSYSQKLQQAIRKNSSTLCVGLDPDPQRIPPSILEDSDSQAEAYIHFCRAIIEATSEYCAAYKPNIAFFEALGPDGIAAFNQVLELIPHSKIVIADAKRGDIGTTAQQYDKAFFDFYKVDALTINPLMGMDTIQVYANHPDKALYVLALTSNPGAADFLLQSMKNGQSVSTNIAVKLKEMQASSQTQLGMVVGATNVDEAAPVLAAHPHAALLIPGVGAQGGSVDQLVDQLKDFGGVPLISSSRSIIYAGENSKHWKSKVAQATKAAQQKLDPITQRYV